jgi:hypothetical protein
MLPGQPAVNTILLARGAIWRYRDAASAPPANWNQPAFDHSTWLAGPAELGFGDNDEATRLINNGQTTSYFRSLFNVSNPAAYTNLGVWLRRDDGGVVYLNGTEIYRSPSLPAYPTPISYGTFTQTGQQDNFVDTATVSSSALISGANLVAVEIHQQDATSSDISFNFELTGFGAAIPAPDQRVYTGTFDGQLTIAWGEPSFQLEVTDQFQGASTVWTPVPGTSPVMITPAPDKPQRFYRLIKP